jgi:hypothetical protein
MLRKLSSLPSSETDDVFFLVFIDLKVLRLAKGSYGLLRSVSDILDVNSIEVGLYLCFICDILKVSA